MTIGKDTFALDQPFPVLAAQDPIEQEGTHRLPEAVEEIPEDVLKVGLEHALVL